MAGGQSVVEEVEEELDLQQLQGAVPALTAVDPVAVAF